MNQILVTEKLYVTPELKRKKKFYKFSFIISIFVIIALASFYVYAEYDKAKSEEISKDILSDINNQTEIIEKKAQEEAEEDKVWKIIISTIEETQNPDNENTKVENDGLNKTEEQENKKDKNLLMYTASNGNKYETVGSINIPKININYPILAETSVELLKIAPCKFFGPETNEIGNLCIAGHNWKNDKFFSKVPNLVNGDVIEITDTTGRTLKYSVYDKYTVVPEDTSCTTQKTNGKKIITLITCTNDNKKRIIVHAKEIE